MDALSVRQAALADVQKALPVFQQINDLYLQAENLNQQVMMSQAKVADGNNRYGKLKGIIAVVLGYAVLNIIFYFVASISEALAIPYIIAVVVGLIVLYNKVKRQDLEKRNLAVQQTRDALTPQMEAISQEVYRIFMENEAVILPIPRDYRNLAAVTFFESALANGRADSMKEALNLYEEHLHRTALEMNSQLALEQSRRQSAMLADIEASSRQTAINSGIAAGFSVLNFLSNI